MSTAKQIIAKLGMVPHPEGGHFKEVWRASAAEGERAIATSIHFLLEAGESSHWHKVDASEIWYWHAGDPLVLRLSKKDEGPAYEVLLGPDVLAGQEVQRVLDPHEWQAAHSLEGGEHGYTLVSCVVAPAFEFEGFVLAEPDWEPGK